jgi:hypothetical protein
MPSWERLFDAAAVPVWIMMLIYFYQIEDKTWPELGLMGFAAAGLVVDALCTYKWFKPA